jgi:hypothetical protein
VEFDDNNIEHVLAGPNYGQPWGDGWNGENSFEEIINKRYVFENFNILFLLST